jgi:hypothetical protein
MASYCKHCGAFVPKKIWELTKGYCRDPVCTGFRARIGQKKDYSEIYKEVMEAI